MPKSKRRLYNDIKHAIINAKISTVQNIINDNTAINLHNRHCDSLLHIAVKYSNPDIVRLLLEASANVDAKNNDGETPLHIAAKYPDLDIVMLLLDNFADVHAKNNNGETPLHRVLAYINTSATRAKKVADITKFLIERKADINAKNDKGYTPFSHAIDCWLNNFDVIKLMVNHGAEINKQDKKGNTILHYVVKKYECYEDVIYIIGLSKMDYKYEFSNYMELLLELNADVNAKNNKHNTPLYQAVRYCHKEIIEIMLKHDASGINNQNNKGKTLLHAAAYSNDSDIIKLLLSYRADPSITDEQGKYPMDYATSSKIIDILYEAYFSTLTSQSDLAAEYQNVNNTSYAEDCVLIDENETEFGLSGRAHSNVKSGTGCNII